MKAGVHVGFVENSGSGRHGSILLNVLRGKLPNLTSEICAKGANPI